MAIAVKEFGAFKGKRVDQFTLKSTSGVKIDLLTWGCVLRDWRVPAPEGKRPVVLGFDTFDPYPQHSQFFGAVAGRVANRIGNGRFTLNGKTYELDKNWNGHTLHGGSQGLSRLIWKGEADSAANAVRFTHTSKDGHMGFPGKLEISATYTLDGNRLRLDFEAHADRPTPVNLVQHHYFNLGLGADVLGHRYALAAPAYTEPAASLIPSGAILPVDGTQYDFRQARTMRDPATERPLHYDINLVLEAGRDPTKPIAVVEGPDKALTLKLWSDRPGLQLYNAVYTDVAVPGIGGRRYGAHSGFCLEDQDFPDAVNHPHFPSTIYGPDRPYKHALQIEIA
jgi:aldose 1-epimerase